MTELRAIPYDCLINITVALWELLQMEYGMQWDTLVVKLISSFCSATSVSQFLSPVPTLLYTPSVSQGVCL